MPGWNLWTGESKSDQWRIFSPSSVFDQDKKDTLVTEIDRLQAEYSGDSEAENSGKEPVEGVCRENIDSAFPLNSALPHSRPDLTSSKSLFFRRS